MTLSLYVVFTLAFQQVMTSWLCICCVQFYILQDSAKADSSTWAGLMHLTFVNDKGEEMTRSVPTNGTAKYAALSSNTVSSYYCQRLPPGTSNCAELKPFVPTANGTCE